jgi:hypothetical protein
LVYIAALGPDETETSQGQQDKFPKTDVFKHIEVADGRVWMKPEGVSYFAGDLTPEEQGIVWSTHFAPAVDLFTQKLDGVAWRSKPSWSIVATQDRTVHPDLERFAAKRMGAKTVEIASSHVPYCPKNGAASIGALVAAECPIVLSRPIYFPGNVAAAAAFSVSSPDVLRLG